MHELFIVVGLKAKAGKEDELRSDLTVLVEPSRNEDGNIRYDLFEDQDEPGHFVFVEAWSSSEARRRHHDQGPHIQHFHANGVNNVDTTEFARMLKRVTFEPSITPTPGAPTDYDAIMQANLTRVFGERDPSRRLVAIRELYDQNAKLHESQASVQGHEAISQAVTDLLTHLPADFVFTAVRPAVGHNGLGRLQWRSGPPNGPAAVTGTDVAHIESGLIRSLHVFLDQSGT